MKSVFSYSNLDPFMNIPSSALHRSQQKLKKAHHDLIIIQFPSPHCDEDETEKKRGKRTKSFKYLILILIFMPLFPLLLESEPREGKKVLSAWLKFLIVISRPPPSPLPRLVRFVLRFRVFFAFLLFNFSLLTFAGLKQKSFEAESFPFAPFSAWNIYQPTDIR